MESTIKHKIGQVEQQDLSGKANIDSPNFTNAPTAPTATVGTNTTQLATTAFVQAALTLNIAQSITNGITTSAPSQDAVFDALAGKVNLSGGTFTGQVEVLGADFKTNGNVILTSTGTGLNAPNNGGITFHTNHPSFPGWTSNTVISSKSFIATDGTIRLKNYIVSTLPTGVQGDTAYVTDALAPTYMTTVVGGGSVVTPVFHNGTNWVAH